MPRLALTMLPILLAAAAPDWQAQLPPGYDVLLTATGDLNGDGLPDAIVALARKNETALAATAKTAPRRPLLVFLAQPGGHYALAGRNDVVVANLGEDWQCDPFTSSSDGLTVKGRYFTVENAAACGTHWSDYVTFRYDPRTRQILFWKEISQNWRMNPSDDPDAEALVKDADTVIRANPAHPITFSHYVRH